MNDAVLKMLDDLGVPAENISFDDFVSEKLTLNFSENLLPPDSGG